MQHQQRELERRGGPVEHHDHYQSPHAFKHSHVQLGAHWIKTAGILAPLVIHEFVKDPDKKWRYIRLASVVTALVSEAGWQHKLQRERDDYKERYEGRG